MFFCNYTIECNSSSVLFYLKTHYMSYWKKGNSSTISLITVNENLYLRIWLPFQPLLPRLYCIQEILMPVPKTDWRCPNWNVYISEIWVLNKTYSVYIYIRVTLVYTFECNVSWIHKHKEKFSTPPPILLENRLNSNS